MMAGSEFAREIADELEGTYARLAANQEVLAKVVEERNELRSKLDAAAAELVDRTRHAAGALDEMTRQRDDAVSRLDGALSLLRQACGTERQDALGFNRIRLPYEWFRYAEQAIKKAAVERHEHN